MREEGDSRYSHSSPKLMPNDECHASFGCHIIPECFRMWAVGFVHGRSFSCMGGRSRAWAFVFMRGHPFSCMGVHFHAWATVFVRGRPSSCMAVVSMRGRLFPCVGGRLDAWWLLALVGLLLCVGSLSCGSAGMIVEGWVVLTVLKNNDDTRCTGMNVKV